MLPCKILVFLASLNSNLCLLNTVRLLASSTLCHLSDGTVQLALLSPHHLHFSRNIMVVLLVVQHLKIVVSCTLCSCVVAWRVILTLLWTEVEVYFVSYPSACSLMSYFFSLLPSPLGYFFFVSLFWVGGWKGL